MYNLVPGKKTCRKCKSQTEEGYCSVKDLDDNHPDFSKVSNNINNLTASPPKFSLLKPVR